MARNTVLTCAMATLLVATVGALGNDHHPSTPVPPSLEIEMLDPNADPLGNPAVETVSGADGRTYVDIPKLVLVHRYYYTGDRSFQYRLIPGGPSILVVNHPKTGERLYIEVTLPPGAPRVSYTSHSIDYDFGPQGVTLVFGHHGTPKIVYHQGHEPHKLVREERTVAGNATPAGTTRVGLVERTRRLGDSVHRAAGAASQGVHSVGQAIREPIVGALRATPLGSRLAAPPGEKALRSNAAATRRAENNPASLLDEATIPTGL